jgi:hypothetical protein
LAPPALHQIIFPAGLGALVFFAGIAYFFPQPPGLVYYRTRGWPMVLYLIGMVCLIVTLLWTAAVLAIYALSG